MKEKLKSLLKKPWEILEKSFSKMMGGLLDSLTNSDNTICKLLNFLRIIDEKNRMSLTNISLMIILFKIATTSATSITDITALATVVFGYAFKKHVESKREK